MCAGKGKGGGQQKMQGYKRPARAKHVVGCSLGMVGMVAAFRSSRSTTSTPSSSGADRYTPLPLAPGMPGAGAPLTTPAPRHHGKWGGPASRHLPSTRAWRGCPHQSLQADGTGGGGGARRFSTPLERDGPRGRSSSVSGRPAAIPGGWHPHRLASPQPQAGGAPRQHARPWRADGAWGHPWDRNCR